MRTILVILFLIIFYIISIPLYLVEYIIGKFNPRAKVRSSQFIVSCALRCILFLSGTKMVVKGLENVPKDTPVLFVANHRGYFDILVSYATVPHLTGFIAKKQMRHIPCISRWMNNLNCLFLDRENIREGLKTILQGIENIKNGYSMYIAPEGTRNQGKEMLPFKAGSFKLAEKSGCPIIPIALTNTESCYETQAPWIKRAKVVIHYGEPVIISDLDKDTKKALSSYVQNKIQCMLDEDASELN
ncbi:MAG: lysophospholipid acyltransferase family protein [bacterium]|nr:lysophospholipid acyltransferase family protein [bacterium]